MITLLVVTTLLVELLQFILNRFCNERKKSLLLVKIRCFKSLMVKLPISGAVDNSLLSSIVLGARTRLTSTIGVCGL